jgi:hypothetical protein
MARGIPRTIVVAVICVWLGGCGSSGGQPAASVATSASVTTAASADSLATTTAVHRPAVHHRHRPREPPPGSLPQTSRLPSSHTPMFRAEMKALWTGIRTGKVSAALPAFFPLGAYKQVKAIADPAADYQARLIGEYNLDIASAHALLGSDAQAARLVGVQVPADYAHWVDPGACYNGIGYYEVPNSRVVYREDGQLQSFGIASMISWRGVWYVVHLGAVVRDTGGGVVDDPSAGVGESLDSGTC